MRIAAFLFLSTLVACGSPAPAPDAVIDGAGRSVDVAGPIQRIVTIAPNATELVFAAGAGDRVVGVSDADDYPPETEALPRFRALPLNHEAVAALRPDLVIGTAGVNSVRDAEGLAEIGIPTYLIRVQSLDEVLSSIAALGVLLDSEGRATMTVDSLAAQRLRLQAETTSEPAPRVIFLIGDDTLFSFGQGAYVHSVIALAGGHSLTESLPLEGSILSEEYVLEVDPDVIVGAWGPGDHTLRLLELHPDWARLRAIRTHRVVGVDPGLVLRAGPRLFEAASVLRGLLHQP